MDEYRFGLAGGVTNPTLASGTEAFWLGLVVWFDDAIVE